MVSSQVIQLAQKGLSVNENDGVYVNGSSCSFSTKMQVVFAYENLITTLGASPSIRKLAIEAQVSRSFASRVIEEYESGSLIAPRQHMGPGDLLFSMMDRVVLMSLFHENPDRTSSDFRAKLYQITKTVASESTILQWFEHRRKIKGGMRVYSGLRSFVQSIRCSARCSNGNRRQMFSEMDQGALLYLRHRKSTRSLSSYRRNLFEIMGTLASEKAISTFLEDRSLIKSGFRVSSEMRSVFRHLRRCNCLDEE